MTVGDYIQQKLPFFHLTDAQFADIYARFGLDAQQYYSIECNVKVNVAIIGIIEEQVLAPRLASVNEGGFSMSWNYADLGKLYMYLCNKYGLTPNSDVVSLLGINMIKDASAKWRQKQIVLTSIAILQGAPLRMY